MSSPLRYAGAGAVAALAWAAAEPLDRRLLRHDYSDVALLGKWLTRGPLWRPAGLAWHAANGALFALGLRALERRRGVEPGRLAVPAALAEHLALFPLGTVVDRTHPARGEPGVVAISSRRAFAQASLRHALFGALLALLVGRR
ncbi:MAG TPA: hypothetical protein VM290_00160 [Gaiellaceae bacterium]|nr:hypothetical protein [Gaiellaceae bacterium]